MQLRLGERGDVVNLADASRLQPLGERLLVVDHGMRSTRETPVARLGPRRGSDDAQSGELARELDQDRAYATRAANDHQRPTIPAAVRYSQAVKQQLPRRDRGQWQRGSLGVSQ